jgi:demethylmenaquinone methyltransferase/2-methoxy-6-polyprenyl-1,4-benzoquinol methylase
VVILEFSLPENGLFGKVYTAYFTKARPAIGRAVSRSSGDAYTYLPDSVLKFPRGGEMCGVMERCGLSDVSARELTLGIVSLYIGKKPLAAEG